jgi:hypothetical protein
MMWNDAIVEEVRRIRQDRAARFDYDLDRIYEDARQAERAGGQLVVFPPEHIPSKASDGEDAGVAAVTMAASRAA